MTWKYSRLSNSTSVMKLLTTRLLRLCGCCCGCGCCGQGRAGTRQVIAVAAALVAAQVVVAPAGFDPASLWFASHLRSEFDSVIRASVPAHAGVLLPGVLQLACGGLPFGVPGLVSRLAAVGGCCTSVQEGSHAVG